MRNRCHPSLVTQEEATTTELPEGIDKPEPFELDVFRNPVDGKQVIIKEETTIEPLKGIDEPELLQAEFRNPADQPSRKSIYMTNY